MGLVAWLGRAGGCAALVSVLLLADGCNSGDDDDAAPVRCSVPADARGGTECQRWQQAICDLGIHCGPGDHCACIESVSSIECVTEEHAADCANEIGAMSCGGTASESCKLPGVANRPWAETGCMEFISGYCAANERCFGTPIATCVAAETAPGADIDCSRAIGLKPWIDQCFTDLEVVACDADDLPSSCIDVVVIF